MCVSPFDSNGQRTAEISYDVGLDNDFIIKGYPQFLVGTKFGNIYETSFRYYPNNGLPPQHQWPVRSTNLDANGDPYEFANLEYVSIEKGVGLPAFTNALPDIKVVLDLDEHNVVGAERDVMLESWFYDTAVNSTIIGNNMATNQPIAGTLNNIVGVGHRHYPQLDNTLLEMMVHIGPLSSNDVSAANNNPGQHQLTEIYSGKDADGDGIDDHFDVDSHAFINSNVATDPSPGLYSSGIDANADGIDDADLLPVVIGDHAYSIWYGTTFLAPLIVFSRETDSSLSSNFDPTVPDMDLSAEGEIVLPWNQFLDYTMNDVEAALQSAGVAWATGADNPFPKMISSSGAIGGVEFGVEPQINNPPDQPYSAVVNNFEVLVNNTSFGLSDSTIPHGVATSPSEGSSIPPATTTITGTASDSESGVSRVRVRIRRLGTSPPLFWNGTTWAPSISNLEATLGNNGSTWSLPGVDLTTTADYRTRVIVHDKAGNIGQIHINPKTDFSVVPGDTNIPFAQTSSPSNGESINAGIVDVLGDSSDDLSGVTRVRVRIQRLGTTPSLYWNGASWSSAATYSDAILNSSGTNWELPDVDLTVPANYRIRLLAHDDAGNIANVQFNATTVFTVVAGDSTIPIAQTTSPSDGATINADVIDVVGVSSDDLSGVSRVRVRIQRLGTSPPLFWNGNGWSGSNAFVEADLSNNGTSWTLPDVDFTVPANYRIRLISHDVARNIARAADNPTTTFTAQ